MKNCAVMEVACSGIEGGRFEDQECGLCVCSHSVFFLFVFISTKRFYFFLKSFSGEALQLRAYAINSCMALIAELGKQLCP